MNFHNIPILKTIFFVFYFFTIIFIFSSCNSEVNMTGSYNGNPDEYVYYYEEGRNKYWENLVLEFANTFLNQHPKLCDKEFRISTDIINNEYYFSNELYDESLRNKFIQRINLLIPKIHELEDSQIIFEMQKIVTLIGDAHSEVIYPSDVFYPILLEAIHTPSGVDFYVVKLPIENEQALFSKLKSINNIPITEIVEIASEYIPNENDYHIFSELESLLCSNFFLENIGIIGKDSDEIKFVFITEQNEELSYKFKAFGSEELSKVNMTVSSLRQKNILMYSKNSNFWCTFVDENTLYIRIKAFYTNDYSSLLKLVLELENIISSDSTINKTIVDIRDNEGGYKVPGYNEFVELLNKKEFGNKYILINDKCFSNGVAMASILKQSINDIILVGCPTGEPPNIFGVNSDPAKFSGTDIYFQIGQYYVKTWPDYEYNALMPDITIYQTIEDYKNGIDTVLNAVISME